MTRIPSVSVSGIKAYLSCRESYRYAYADRMRLKTGSDESMIGNAVHVGLAEWWEGRRDRSIWAMMESKHWAAIGAYPRELARVMLAAYDAYWGNQHDYEPGISERKFYALRQGYQWIGAIDVTVGSTVLVEHKTTSQDISEGSDYWARLKADLQVGLYFEAAKSLGMQPEVMVYDVIRRPDLRPLKATPHASRKYTKAGQIYAGQRTADETPEEYGDRVAETMSRNPDSWFRRLEIVRLEDERERSRAELDSLARDVLRVLPGVPEPRTGAATGACRRCDYVRQCLHGADFGNEFVRKDYHGA